VGYQRNYTVQNDFAAIVPAAQRTFAAEELRISKVEHQEVLSRHLMARDYLIDGGLFAAQADSDAEAQRLFELWGATVRRAYRVRLRPKAMPRDIGQVLELEHSRHGLTPAKQARVFGHDVQGFNVELKVLV
jgi:hypothetical protein